jgi:hypothetical protein
LLPLLREEAGLYTRLETFAARQRLLVDTENTTPLMHVLADRQRILVRLNEVTSRLSPARRAWASYCERLAPAERAEADRLARDTQDSLRRLLESDEHDARLLSARKEAAAASLRVNHANRQAVSAYRTTPVGANRRSSLDEAQ